VPRVGEQRERPREPAADALYDREAADQPERDAEATARCSMAVAVVMVMAVVVVMAVVMVMVMVVGMGMVAAVVVVVSMAVIVTTRPSAAIALIVLVIMSSRAAALAARWMALRVVMPRRRAARVRGVFVVFVHGGTLGGKGRARNRDGNFFGHEGLACNPRKI
jgi:uncharacterized RDD family membrane protein YckC